MGRIRRITQVLEELRQLVAVLRRLLWAMTGAATAGLAFACALASLLALVTG